MVCACGSKLTKRHEVDCVTGILVMCPVCKKISDKDDLKFEKAEKKICIDSIETWKDLKETFSFEDVIYLIQKGIDAEEVRK